MLLFKTSGSTFKSVILNEKHAFASCPKEWVPGEGVLVSKNKVDCGEGEKQIQYIMRLRDIRRIRPGEAGNYWPGNEGRWNYLVECSDTQGLERPFDLVDAIGDGCAEYRTVMTFKKLSALHEKQVNDYLKG